MESFVTATRMKVRFETVRGFITTEDLWDLPLTSVRGTNLNDIAKGLNRELKAASEEDFVDKSNLNPVTTELQVKFDVVKQIIDIRLAENEEQRLKTEKKQKKEKLLELISKKQDQDLENKPVEDLVAMVNDL